MLKSSFLESGIRELSPNRKFNLGFTALHKVRIRYLTV